MASRPATGRRQWSTTKAPMSDETMERGSGGSVPCFLRIAAVRVSLIAVKEVARSRNAGGRSYHAQRGEVEEETGPEPAKVCLGSGET